MHSTSLQSMIRVQHLIKQHNAVQCRTSLGGDCCVLCYRIATRLLFGFDKGARRRFEQRYEILPLVDTLLCF